jgi:sigma-B regulation protein RsbQ
MIGVLAANTKREIFKDLILVGPSPRYINDAGYTGGFEHREITGMLEALHCDFFAWSSVIAPVIMGNSGMPELSDELSDSFCRSNITIAENFAHLMFLGDNRADLHKVKTKTLILQCSEDAIAPLAVGGYMHQQIPGSQLHVLQATGHCPHLSAPEEIIAAMQDYLGGE